MELKIDHEFETMIPPLTKEEFKELEYLIVHDRIIYSPILHWNGVIIDGHNRYRIVQKHPEVHCSQRLICFHDRDEARAWICKNQLGRRNLTPAQKKYLIGKQYESEKACHGGDRKSSNRGSSPQSDDLITGRKTSEKIAKETRTSKAYVERAGNYAKGLDAAEEVLPGIRQMVFAGDIHPTEKDVTAVGRAKENDRKALAENLKTSRKSSAKRNQEPGSFKPSTRSILAISEAMDSSNGYTASTVDTDFVITELEHALESMAYRWRTCINDYREIAMAENCRKKIQALVKEGIRFLEEYG